MYTIDRLLNNSAFASELTRFDHNPVLLVVDFNSFSHLDCIKSNKHLHCNCVMSLPLTNTLVDDVQLIDSYHEIYLDTLVYLD